MIKLTRHPENPILTPTNHPWENMLVFNPAAIMDNGIIYLLYRAMGTDFQLSRLGMATGKDGVHFDRKPDPVYFGGLHYSENLGIEDARIVKMDDTFYLVYTAVSADSEYLEGEIDPMLRKEIGKIPQIALSTTKDFEEFLDYDIILPELTGKDASLFPKKNGDEYWLLFRAGTGATYFANSPRLDYWPETYPVFDRRVGLWDSVRVGIGSPPIETEKGWLLFYHGIDESLTYRLGIMFLDLDDPRKVLYRSNEPILEPETDYEKFGFVNNVVFTCGALEKDDMYFVYYGAGDQVICLATVEKKEVLTLF